MSGRSRVRGRGRVWRLAAVAVVVLSAACQTVDASGGQTAPATASTSAATPSGSPATAAPSDSASPTPAVAPAAVADRPGRGELAVAVGTRLDHLDPHKMTQYPAYPVLSQVYDTLVVPDAQTLQLRGSLAVGWSVSGDRLAWTFRLRDDVTFHDGSAFDATDVVYTLRRVLDEDLVSARRIPTVSDVTAVDDRTVRITVSEPTPDLPARLGTSTDLAILPSNAARDLDLAAQANGTGPFRLDRVDGNSVHLRAFGDYWGDASAIRGVEIRFVPDPQRAVAAVRAATVDWTDHVEVRDLPALSAGTDVVVGRVPSVDAWYLTANARRPPFDDPRVRRALAFALDRQRIVDGVGLQAATVNQTAIPHDSVWATSYAPYTWDPQRARRMLADAGVADLSIGLMVTEATPRTITAARLVKRQLARVGVTAELQRVEFDEFLRRRDARDYDLLLSGWLGAVDPYTVYYQQHVCGGRHNVSGYCSPRTDALLVAAEATSNQRERAKRYGTAVARIVDEAATIYLYNTDVVQVWSPDLSGVTTRADRTVNFELVEPSR